MLHKKLKHLVFSVAIIVLAIAFLFPVVFTVLTSFIEEEQINIIFGSNISWRNILPYKLTLSSYDRILFDYFSFYTMFWN